MADKPIPPASRLNRMMEHGCPHCKKQSTVKFAKAEALTADKAVEAAIKEIRAYKGAAIERAVYGAIGAATALERMNLLSTEDGANWCVAVRKAGDEQRARTESNVFRGKKKGPKR